MQVNLLSCYQGSMDTIIVALCREQRRGEGPSFIIKVLTSVKKENINRTQSNNKNNINCRDFNNVFKRIYNF